MFKTSILSNTWLPGKPILKYIVSVIISIEVFRVIHFTTFL